MAHLRLQLYLIKPESKAKYILSFDDRDENNAEIALKVMQIVSEKKGNLITCIIQIVNPQSYLIIKKQSYSSQKNSRVRIEFYNQYAFGARTLLEKYPPFKDKGEASEVHFLSLLLVRVSSEKVSLNALHEPGIGSINQITPVEIIPVDLNADQVIEDLEIQHPMISTC